jgi:CheY-like chemotaxis protein
LVLDITAEMLEDLGCEVVTAPNAKEALNVPCYRKLFGDWVRLDRGRRRRVARQRLRELQG